MAHGEFRFSGNGLSCLWLFIWTSVLSVLTLGLSFPWTVSALVGWVTKFTTIDGKQLCFKGTGLGFFGNWLLILFLTFVTLGIYTPWGICRFYKWIINNVYFADAGDVEDSGGSCSCDTPATVKSLTITVVKKGGQAEELDLMSGDIIKTYNKVDVFSNKDLSNAIMEAKNNVVESVALVIVREGELQTYEIMTNKTLGVTCEAE